MRGLYVHIPFCRSKCPYCGFYSEISSSDTLIKAHFDACLKSISSVDNNNFDTIYFGGGTPSSVPIKELESFTKKLLDNIIFNGLEFTIEANPESVSEDFVSFVKNHPITRVSLGVQSLNNDVLKKLGRIHDSKKALEACNALLKCDISLNTDIIFDIPGVDKDIIFQTLDALSSFDHDHISAYSYSSEDTGYLSGFDTDFSIYEDVEAYLESKNFRKYEISNFAKKGKESQHNIIYWTGDEYMGIGAGAHSMLYSNKGLRQRSAFTDNIYNYINAPFSPCFFEELDNETAFKETVIFGLRMKKGIIIRDIEKRFGKISSNLLNNIQKYTNQGLLQWDSEFLRTTKKGALVLDSLSQHLWE